MVVLVVITLFIFNSLYPTKPFDLNQLSVLDIIRDSFASLSRLIIAYVIALILSVPLALLITATPKLEKVLLPFFDVLESVPVLAFFPVIVLIFIKINYFNGAAIFVLIITMIWSLVFSMIGGINTMPSDIKEAAFVFKARGLKKLFSIILPAVFPFIVTGSILAWASGWNILIVAEVLHNYIPGSSEAVDLPGLGNLLVKATFAGNQALFILTLTVMVALITLLNLFVWQRLLKLAERYKFE
jgi:NitT/TauT family transport system permease protein